MKTSEVAVELIKNDDTERPVFVTLFLRDENFNVLSKKRFPVEAVVSHREGTTEIYIEQSNGFDEYDWRYWRRTE
jgi:hypothetical protein